MARLQERTFSPSQLAQALGVSESTLKRWIDAERIKAMKTAGGHRRVPFREVVRFVRAERLEVPRPDLLGLADALGGSALPTRAEPLTAKTLATVLQSGSAVQARSLLVTAYLRGASLAALCDGPVREAMREVGTLWAAEDEQVCHAGIYVEHQATDLMVQAFGQIRSLIPAPPPGAPVTLGAAPNGDPYLLPSIMAAACLSDQGFEAVNLGPQTPEDTFLEAARHTKPKLAWLSVSAATATHDLSARIAYLATALAEMGTPLVVGGREVHHLAQDLPNVIVETSMSGLVRVARQVMG